MSGVSITIGQILDVVSAFDGQDQVDLSIPEMLEQVLVLVAEYIPDQYALQVHRWNGSTFSLWASTRPETPHREGFAADNPAIFTEAIRRLTPLEDNTRWVVPLHSQGHRSGILEVIHRDPVADPVPEWLHLIGRQLGAVLFSHELLDQYLQAAERLQRISEFSQLLQSTLNKAEIFDIALTEGVRMLPLDYMSIVLYDSSHGRLQVVARYEDGMKLTNLLELPLKNTPGGQVWETRKLLVIPDLTQNAELQHPFRKDLRSLLTAPIFSRGLALGMAEVGSFSPHAYDENDIAVFQQMVTQLSVTIENAEAYAQSQAMAKNKALAGEIAAHLQQQTDIEGILNVTVMELGKALGARQARIRMGMDYAGDSQS